MRDAQFGDSRLSTEREESRSRGHNAVDPVRRGIATHLADLRGFARYLTRDASSADDLVQDTVLRALAARDSFIPGTNIKAWLFTILRNTFYEQHRRRVKETEILDEISRRSEGGYDERDSFKDRVMDLSLLLWRLPDILREAIILVGAQELSYEEAAAICDCPVGTMKALAAATPSVPQVSIHNKGMPRAYSITLLYCGFLDFLLFLTLQNPTFSPPFIYSSRYSFIATS